MDRLTSGKRVKQNVEGDTQVFEPGMLGQSPDGYVCYYLFILFLFYIILFFSFIQFLGKKFS